MKQRSELTYGKAILFGLLTELTLVAIQLIYMKIYEASNPDDQMIFSTDYMKYRGFYIFQIVGFFIYTLIIFIILNKLEVKSLTKLFAMLITGGIIELSFYLIIPSEYEGAFLFSILDKFIAAIFAIIVYNYTTRSIKES